MDDLIFSFGELLACVSQPFELQPGDIIATGSPSGIGALTGHYLKPGDEVRIELGLRGVAEPLATLRRGVVAG